MVIAVVGGAILLVLSPAITCHHCQRHQKRASLLLNHNYCTAGTSSKAGFNTAAIIAIAVVGGAILLVLIAVITCCCRSRYKAKEAAAVGAVADKGPAPKAVTPTAPEPFSVNYPQFQVRPGVAPLVLTIISIIMIRIEMLASQG